MIDLNLMVLNLQQKVDALEGDNQSLTTALDITQKALGLSVCKLISIQKVLEEDNVADSA